MDKAYGEGVVTRSVDNFQGSAWSVLFALPGGLGVPNLPQQGAWSAVSAKRAERPDSLTRAQFEFCLAYIANGFNATAAYQAAYPKVGAATAATNGYRLLRNADVVAFLEPELQARWRDQQMNGEEALARLATQARADVRQLFDRRGQLLPPHRWPDEMQAA